MEKLFSYGTLRERDVQTELFGREVEMSEATLPGYAIRPIRLGDETHKLAMPGDETNSIEGAVLEITERELDICDSYEPGEYRRIEVTLESGENAWAYVAAK